MDYQALLKLLTQNGDPTESKAVNQFSQDPNAAKSLTGAAKVVGQGLVGDEKQAEGIQPSISPLDFLPYGEAASLAGNGIADMAKMGTMKRLAGNEVGSIGADLAAAEQDSPKFFQQLKNKLSNQPDAAKQLQNTVYDTASQPGIKSGGLDMDDVVRSTDQNSRDLAKKALFKQQLQNMKNKPR